MTAASWVPVAVVASSLLPGLIIFTLPEERRTLRTALNLAGAAAKLTLVLVMLWNVGRFQDYEARLALLPGLDLVLRADELSLLFLTLSAVLWAVTTVYAIGYLEDSPNRSRFFGFFSLCVSATAGIALAGNLFTLFVFYEILTLVTYPLVIHRGTPASLAAGRSYLMYTLPSGALLLLAVAGAQVLAGPQDFAGGGYLQPLAAEHAGTLVLLFAALVTGFGVKAALVPLHGWLPQAMVAPAPVSALLHAAGPGDVAWAVVAIVLSNVFFTYGESLIAAFLPELARQDSLGRVSGWGWAFGYFGGMLTLGLSLAYVIRAQGQGLPASHFVPVTMWITADIFALATLATFALLKERARPQAAPAGGSGIAASLARLRCTWREARRFRDFSALLACAVAYQAGISVVVALSAVYAEQVLRFEQTETMMLIFLVNVAAAAGAFAWGYVQDRIGHRPALGITLAGWIVMTVLAALATGPGLFWVAAVIAGLCMGSSQSAGRALAGAFSPEQRRAEFYGLWTFAIRVSAILGPMTYGLVTWLTEGNHRLAIVSTGSFFVLGLLLLAPVNVPRGIAAAGGEEAACDRWAEGLR